VLQKLRNLVSVLFNVYASAAKNLDAFASVVFKSCLGHFIISDT
jgi:hypothetical protein